MLDHGLVVSAAEQVSRQAPARAIPTVPDSQPFLKLNKYRHEQTDEVDDIYSVLQKCGRTGFQE